MIKLVALKSDGAASLFFKSVQEIAGDRVFCRFLQDGEKAKENEIAVFFWSKGCPGKYFRTAPHILRGRADERLASAKAFLGVKRTPTEKAVKEILADMKNWPRPKRIKPTPKEAKRRGVYLGAW